MGLFRRARGNWRTAQARRIRKINRKALRIAKARQELRREAQEAIRGLTISTNLK